MSFATPLTPTKNKTNSSQAQASGSTQQHHHTMDDINMLLYLDAVKRKVDNENAITQKMDEAHKIYQKRKYEYFTLYSRYVELVKKAATHRALKGHGLTPIELSTASEDMRKIKEKLSSGSATDYIHKEELEHFKELLRSDEKHDNLKNLRLEMMDLKITTKSIQSSIESTEAAIDNATNQGLDLFADELDMENFPKLSKMHGIDN